MSSLIYWLDSSLSHQMWSAHWIHGAGKSGPRCYETHLNNVLDRHLCTRVGSDCPGSDDEPPSTRRTLIPTLSYGEDTDIHSVVFLQIYWRIFFFFCIPAFSSCLLQETQNIKNTLAGNVKRAVEVVNSLPGLCCQPLEGGAFVFPRVYLPPSFIQKAKVNVDINQRCDQKKRAYQWFKYYQPGHVFVYFRKRDWNQIHSTVVDYWKRLVCSSVLVLSTDKRRAPTTSGITHHATLVCSPYCRPANDTEVPAAVPPDYRTAIFSPGSTH